MTLATPAAEALNDAAFAEHLEGFSGLPWLQERKRTAWERFRALPAPRRNDERWRFATLTPLEGLERFRPAPLVQPDAEALVERSQRLEGVAGRLIFVDDNLAAARHLAPGLEAQGVIFTTLLDACNRHPEVLRQHFLENSPELGSEKYEALHIAFLRAGVFLHIPKGVSIEQPFVVYHWAQEAETALFPHTLFVCEDHASATLIEFQEGAQADSEHLVIANQHLVSGDNARPRAATVQNWNEHTVSFQLNTTSAQHNSEPKSVQFNLGSAWARQEMHGRVYGSNSNVEMYALALPHGTQRYDQRTLQTHIAPNSRSDLLYKNALLDDSSTLFSGLIVVEDEAQQTDAYQTNNNLMLSDSAEAHSLPGLEIQANDVKCSHGATTGQIDDSNLFYFLARGIPRKQAEALLVFGFMEEIIDKLEHEGLAAYVREAMQRKFPA